MIANAGGGEYLELDREGDREIANRIIDAARRRAGSRGLEVANEELYWRFLLAAAGVHVASACCSCRSASSCGCRPPAPARRARAGLDADPLMRARTAPVAALLFGSGFCALVYQVGWLREFRLIFGASTAASAAVLAIFIGGLGAGGLLLGPRADRHPRPLLFYATLEAIVAVSAALSPLLLIARARDLSRQRRLDAPRARRPRRIERLLLSVVVLAVPTIAMGGTLPAAARAVTAPATCGARISRRSTR